MATKGRGYSKRQTSNRTKSKQNFAQEKSWIADFITNCSEKCRLNKIIFEEISPTEYSEMIELKKKILLKKI